MTRGQIRTLLRRQVQDVPGVEWDDSELNEVINIAYAKVQKEIVKAFPEAHLMWDYMNTSTSDPWYPLPQTFGIKRVGLKQYSTDTKYTKLEPKGYSELQDKGSSMTSTYYALRGQWIYLSKLPASVVANGLEIVHAPILTMAADSDVPRIKSPLHDAIIYWSGLILMGETTETTNELRTRLAETLNDLPSWYDQPGDTAEKLEIQGL